MSDSNDQSPKKPGQVKHDASGRAVWQWAAESGRHAIDSTSRLLKRLEVPGLKLEEYQPKSSNPAHRAAANEAKPAPAAGQHVAPERLMPPDPEKGYDPYGGRNDLPHGAARHPAAPRPEVKPAAPAAAPLKKPDETPATRRSLLGRLFRK
jgi:hypothetical protein